MTQSELQLGSQRLAELERLQALSEQTLRDLRQWWNKKLWQEEHKVVSIDDYRKRRWLS